MASESMPSADPTLHRRLVDAWVDSQHSPNTRAAYRADLNAFGAWCARQGAIPLRADTETVVAFQAAREAAGDSPSTLRRRWSALSSYYDFAVGQDATPTNPVLGASRPRTPAGDPSPTTRLSPEAVAEYRAIAAALDPRLDALVALIVADGLKLSEVLALDVNDVRGRAPTTRVTVRRRGTTKQITLDVRSARAVRRCIGRRNDGPLLISKHASPSGQPLRLTRFGADHLIRQLSPGEEQRVTTNELRRFHISNGHDHDADLEEVRDRAGLAHVRSVRRYVERATPEART